MAAFTLTPYDLEPFAEIPELKAQAMIDDVLAIAAAVAPALLEDSFAHGGAAKAILRETVLWWHAAGAGVTITESKGPFSTTISARKGIKTHLLEAGLGDLSPAGGAYDIDTVSRSVGMHADICTLNFGGLYCSCGAVLTNLFPLYEV